MLASSVQTVVAYNATAPRVCTLVLFIVLCVLVCVCVCVRTLFWQYAQSTALNPLRWRHGEVFGFDEGDTFSDGDSFIDRV